MFGMWPAQPVSAAVPEQRQHGPVRGGDDLAYEQQVIAGTMNGVMPALEPGRTAIDQRRVRGPEPEGHAREAIGVRAREAAGQFDLIMGKDIDGILRGAVEDRQTS